MTMVVGLLLVVLGVLVGSAMALVFAWYMRWVRRNHPRPAVRAWRLLFVFPSLVVMFATIQAAGVSPTSAADIHLRGLVPFGFLAGFVGTPLAYWLRHRSSRR